MLGWRRKKVLLGEIQEIFKANNMNREEIIAFLEMGEADYSDRRLHNATDKIAELVSKERLSFEDFMRLLKLYRKAI